MILSLSFFNSRIEMKDLGILWTVVYTIQLCWGQDEQESISLQWQNDIRPKRFEKLFSKDYQSFSGILKNDSSKFVSLVQINIFNS